MKNTKQVMLRMPPALYDRLSSAADNMMTTPSALARILVKLQLDQWDGELRSVRNEQVYLRDSGLPEVPSGDRRYKKPEPPPEPPESEREDLIKRKPDLSPPSNRADRRRKSRKKRGK